MFESQNNEIKHVEILDLKIHPMNIDDLLAISLGAIEENNKIIIGHHNLHSIYLCYHDNNMEKFYDLADFVFIDGMPIIHINNLLNKKKLKKNKRITSIDWIYPFLELAELKNWKIFYLGSKLGVAEKGASIWKAIFPKLNIITSHGYFDQTMNSSDNREIIDKINKFHPHVLFVGFGMPKQENWVRENYSKINSQIIIPIGACIDYYAGEISTPPRSLSGLGFEWLFRLLDEPGRLWKRYLIEPWYILFLLIKKIIIKFIFTKSN